MWHSGTCLVIFWMLLCANSLVDPSGLHQISYGNKAKGVCRDQVKVYASACCYRHNSEDPSTIGEEPLVVFWQPLFQMLSRVWKMQLKKRRVWRVKDSRRWKCLLGYFLFVKISREFRLLEKPLVPRVFCFPQLCSFLSSKNLLHLLCQCVCRWASWWTPTMPTLCRQQFVLPGVFICLGFCGYLFAITFVFTLNCLADVSAPLKSTTSAGSRSPSFPRISKVIKTLGVKPRLLYLEEKEASWGLVFGTSSQTPGALVWISPR